MIPLCCLNDTLIASGLSMHKDPKGALMQISHDEFLQLHLFHKVKPPSKITNHSSYSMSVTAA